MAALSTAPERHALIGTPGTAVRTRLRLGGAVVALVASLVAILTPAPPAAAQTDLDGVRIVADTIYRVLPDEGVVEVEISFAVTNQIPDRREGLQIVQTFLTSIPGVYPDAATDLRAVRDNGEALTVTRAELSAEEAAGAAEAALTVWNIDLGPNLFFGQTRRLTVTYRLPDGPARSPDTWARVNPAYASFPVLARGDSGLSSVRIDFPPGFAVESFGSELSRRSAFGGTVLEATEIADPGDFFALLVGSSEFGLNSRPVEVDGVPGDLVISSWPGDEEWDAFVERGLVEGIPFLVDEIGVPWPVEGELEVIETVAPALAGYGGWFYEPGGSDGTDAAIDVGEELLFDLLGHEISHAWFNDDFTRMRWLNEGLAEYFGVRMATELDADIELFEPVTASSPDAVDLLDWRDPVFSADEVDPTEAYGYSASFQVISEIADEIGPDSLRAALGTLFDAENPYRPSLTDPGPALVDWRDLLDALELVGGSEAAEEVLVTWVLGDDEEDDLVGRAEAQAAAATLEDREPGWSVPDVVPTLLADWKFDDALMLVSEMSAILDDAQALIDAAAARAIVVPTGAREQYEAIAVVADGLDGVRQEIAAQRESLDQVLASYERAAEPTGFFADIGLLGADVDAGVADARAAFEAGDYERAISLATDANRLLDDAEARGQQRLAIAIASVLGVALLVLLGVLFFRRRRRVPPPVVADGT